MNNCTIITQTGEIISATRAETGILLRSGKYERYFGTNENGGTVFLLAKDDDTLSEIRRFLHNEEARLWAEKDRSTRCVLKNGTLCTQPKRYCETCSNERSARFYSVEERTENGIHESDPTANVEETVVMNDFIAEMHSVLEQLEAAERHIVKALYGVDEPLVSLADYANAHGMKYSTARSVRDRAFRKLQKLCTHLKDYID